MTTWFNSIFSGISFYMTQSIIIFAPLGMLIMVCRGKINPMRFLLGQLFILYMCCVIAVVFFPLPSPEAAATLTYKYQLIPFFFVKSLITDPSVNGIFGVIFNILMTIPFGMYLRYNNKMSRNQILLLGFALTLFIEIGQLTGLFFIYHGSYRLFDVDDLIHNTLGAYLGYLLIARIEGFLPAIGTFDMETVELRDPEDTLQVMYIS